MRAIWVEAPGGLEKLEERELSKPEPREGEVRVRVKAIGLNPVDAAWRRGEHLPPLPGVLGRDFSGVVDAVGGGVTKLREGDAVLGYAAGASNGAYAEYLCIGREMVAPKPSKLSFEHAAALPVAGLTAARIRQSARDLRTAVLVTGASGAVGSMLLPHILDDREADMIATTSSEAGERHLRALGVTTAIVRLDRANWRTTLERSMGSFTTVVDLAGGPIKQLALEMLAPGWGELVTIVEEPPDFPVRVWDDESPIVHKSLAVRFVQLSSFVTRPGAPRPKIGWYEHALEKLADEAVKGKYRVYLEGVQVLGSLSAETARKAHALLDARAHRGKLLMSV